MKKTNDLNEYNRRCNLTIYCSDCSTPMIYAYPLMDNVICIGCGQIHKINWDGMGLSTNLVSFITEDEKDEINKLIK